MTKFKLHESSEGHKDAATRVASYHKVSAGTVGDVRSQLFQAHQARLAENRNKLRSIVSTILLF